MKDGQQSRRNRPWVALAAGAVVIILLLLALLHPGARQYSAALAQVRGYLLLVVLMLLGLPLLMRRLFASERREDSSLLYRCVVGSVLAHLLLAFLFSVWVISREVYQTAKSEPLEVTVATDALAAERLALEIREHVAELPNIPEPVLAGEQRKEKLPLPHVEPVTQLTGADSPPLIAAEAFAVSVEPPAPVAEQPVDKLEPARIAAPVATLQVVPLGITLEAPPRVAQAPPRETATKPDIIAEFPREAPRVEAVPERLPGELPPSAPMALPPREDLAFHSPQRPKPAIDATVVDLPEKLTGPALGSLSLIPDMKLETKPQDIERYSLRDPKAREQLVEKLGGSKETEKAIARALDWFTRNQEPDGSWSGAKHGGVKGHDVAATSLALLCYMGWGATHRNGTAYQEQVGKALKWLLTQVKADGDLRGNGGDMYDQGIGAIALAEAYGLTADESLRSSVERAIGFITRGQNTDGGWRYRPASGMSDTSVVGWQVMALRSAELAGLALPPPALDGARRWLKFVGGGKHGGLYGYQDKQPRPAMVAEGMFCQQLLGAEPGMAIMKESADYLKAHLPKASEPDFYYWYYGCLSLYQHQGPIWEEWNKQMRDLLVTGQSRSGKDSGSWQPRGPRSERAGRAATTAFATLSLEVYYRYLPLYGGAVRSR